MSALKKTIGWSIIFLLPPTLATFIPIRVTYLSKLDRFLLVCKGEGIFLGITLGCIGLFLILKYLLEDDD